MNRKRTYPPEIGVIPRLRSGDNLSCEEFLQRWDEEPELKFAELIGGVVHMPSPLSSDHGRMEMDISGWLGNYLAATPGITGGNNCTTLIQEQSPQPDVHLRILPEYGGATWDVGKLIGGPPELVVEVCASSAAYDLHQKYDLYEEAGVQEYVAVLLYEQEIRWHRPVVSGDVSTCALKATTGTSPSSVERTVAITIPIFDCVASASPRADNSSTIRR